MAALYRIPRGAASGAASGALLSSLLDMEITGTGHKTLTPWLHGVGVVGDFRLTLCRHIFNPRHRPAHRSLVGKLGDSCQRGWQ